MFVSRVDVCFKVLMFDKGLMFDKEFMFVLKG